MPKLLALALVAILALCVPATAAEPTRVQDPEKFCSEFMNTLSKNGPLDAANLIANTIGKPDSAEGLQRFLQIFERKRFDYSSKVIDKEFNKALRQIVFYSYVEQVGFAYFRFNFKMTSSGWVLANFSFKGETNELFPKDFVEH
jgi:hypothetical protein